MANAQVVLAIVRAARPTFRSRHDKLAFAIHATISANGYRLVGLGPEARLQGASATSEELGIEGWNAQDDQYRFVYVADASPLLFQGLVMGDLLLASFTTQAESPALETVELDTSKYTADGADAASAYANLDELTKAVQSSLEGVQRKPPAAPAAPAAGSTQLHPTPAPPQQRHPDDDPLRIGPVRQPRHPLAIGPDDYMPQLGGGFPEDFAPGPHRGGLPMPGGGGLHVGPDHPYFRDRLRNPELHPGHGLPTPPGLPPGARWDPISPPGMEGYRPEDFYTHPGELHPDIMPPGPGRRPNGGDSMFG